MPELWTPRKIAWRCEVPVRGENGVLRECGKAFYAEERSKYIRHTAQCAIQHEEEIQSQLPRNKGLAIFNDPDFWDPEKERYMRNLGALMVREGRMETRSTVKRVNGKRQRTREW